jgi:hypothetical protein
MYTEFYMLPRPFQTNEFLGQGVLASEEEDFPVAVDIADAYSGKCLKCVDRDSSLIVQETA